MKKVASMIAVALLVIQSPAAVVLTITSLGNGDYQIVAPGNSSYAVIRLCVLQKTTNFVTWTSISTNVFPIVGTGYGVTNIVQNTNAMAFYRVEY